MLIFALRTYSPLDHDLWLRVAGALFLAWFALALYGQMRGQYGPGFARASRRSLAVIAFAPAAMAAIIGANGALDLSEPKQQSAMVTRLWTTPGRGVSIAHHLEVLSWRPGRQVEQFVISEPLYSRLHSGDAVAVELHEGSLGITWIGPIELRASTQDREDARRLEELGGSTAAGRTAGRSRR